MTIFLLYSAAVLLAVLARNKVYVIMLGCVISITVQAFLPFPNFWLDIVVVYLVVEKVRRCILFGERVRIDILTGIISIYLTYLFIRAAMTMEKASFMEVHDVIMIMALYPLFLNHAEHFGWNRQHIEIGAIIISIISLISFIIYLKDPLAYILFFDELGMTQKKDLMNNESFRFISIFRSPLYCGQAFMVLTMILFTRRNAFFVLPATMLIFTQTRAPTFLTFTWILSYILWLAIGPILKGTFRYRKTDALLLCIIPAAVVALIGITLYLSTQNKVNLSSIRFFDNVLSGYFLEERAYSFQNFSESFGRSVWTMLFGNGVNAGEFMGINIDDGNFFKVLFEQGLVGFLIYIGLYAVILVKACIAKEEWSRMIYVTIFFMFTTGITTTVFTSYFSQNLLFAAAGITVCEAAVTKKT